MSTRLWRRVRQGLAQYARQRGINSNRMSSVSHALHEITRLCGEATQSRKALYRLGCALLQDRPHILVPICPDYTNRNGKFTFEGLGSGVPILLQLHMKFLLRVKEWIPRMRVTFLLADQESQVPELCAILKVTPTEFRCCIERSIHAASQFLETSRWKIVRMTQYIPHFSALKIAQAEALSCDEELRAYLDELTQARASFYRRIGYDPTVWLMRTTQNAAEYLVLGRFAAERRAIVCNHSTANLAWFNRTGTAVLHDPIRVY